MLPSPDAASLPVTYRYEVDWDDRIRYVDKNWLAFARQNDAEDLRRTRVLGVSLWQFVSGPDVLHIYGLLFERARRFRARHVLPFRCDAPGVRRDMELTIHGLRRGAISLTGALLREQARPRVELLDTWAPRSREVIRMCSWCKRAHVKDAWVEVEDATAALSDATSGDPPRLTHGICRRCEASLLAR